MPRCIPPSSSGRLRLLFAKKAEPYKQWKSLIFLSRWQTVLPRDENRRVFRLVEPEAEGMKENIFESRHHSWMSTLQISDFPQIQDSPIYGEGTVWDLVPMPKRQCILINVEDLSLGKTLLRYILERLREPLSDSKGGCIISHPPGTGKTRLTIVFLQSFLKLFPNSRPVIIAPSNLFNREAEFRKWEVDIPFHNLNSKDFSS
ncbi:hypothetical protein HAX54_051751 [Datura stramonium]|uniref:Uncharacterized protein n=1 Tax=Datura stramonium TaxID=4076 RepID=A0ABS8WRM8_DATST|nr:hypothetical protein [Datura stramonium]